ncbi:MAG: prepilin-type N-terminal cleavage/methylation domain-containing protein [Candidatus Paceibacterota bacterium]
MIVPFSARGFTLAEMVLVLALMSLLGSLTAFVNIGAYKRLLARTDVDRIVGALVQARSEAMHGVCKANICDTPPPHGVRVGRNEVTVFEGSSYSDRIATVDETFFLDGTMASGTNEVVFVPITGEVSDGLDIFLTGVEGSASNTWHVQIATSGNITSNAMRVDN